MSTEMVTDMMQEALFLILKVVDFKRFTLRAE